jgi:molybdate transport system substrate-binding protein
VFEVPDEFNVIATYPIAVVKAARNAEAARLFVELVRGDEGQRVLQQHGLLPATAAEPASHP